MKQKELNDFKRKYFNLSIRRYQGHIVHDPGTSHQHRELVNRVCEWLNDNKYIYFTRVHLKEGKIADIVAPELPRPIIEVRHSELEKNKEYLSDYDYLRIMVDTTDPYKLR